VVAAAVVVAALVPVVAALVPVVELWAPEEEDLELEAEAEDADAEDADADAEEAEEVVVRTSGVQGVSPRRCLCAAMISSSVSTTSVLACLTFASSPCSAACAATHPMISRIAIKTSLMLTMLNGIKGKIIQVCVSTRECTSTIQEGR
jgi:hypothetical protein